MIREYNHTQHTNPRHHEKEPQTTDSYKLLGRQLKQSKQLSLPHHSLEISTCDPINTKWTIPYYVYEYQYVCENPSNNNGRNVLNHA